MSEVTIRGFLEKEYPRLVAGVTLACGSRPTAEDAVQEALARAWVRIERGDSFDSLSAWVTAVAINESRSHFRRLKSEARSRARLHDQPSSREPQLPPDTEARVDIARALAGLPRRQREVAVMRFYLDRSIPEIADALHIKPGTVKSQLHKAKSKLAEALGAEEDDHEVEADHVIR